jgi:hypothetical protein
MRSRGLQESRDSELLEDSYTFKCTRLGTVDLKKYCIKYLKLFFMRAEKEIPRRLIMTTLPLPLPELVYPTYDSHYARHTSDNRCHDGDNVCSLESPA